MSIKLRWLGTNCFEIVLPSGKVLVIDPYIDYSPTSPIKSDEVTGADYIAITHTHFDHCSDTGVLVNKFHSKVICSYSEAGKLAEFFQFRWTNLVRVRAGDTVVFDDLKIEAKRAEHYYIPEEMTAKFKKEYKPPLDKIVPAMQAAGLSQIPVRDMEMLDYIFQTSDNLRIMFFGGAPFEYQRNEIMQSHPNVLVMGSVVPAVSAQFAALSGAELVLPCHHDTGMVRTHARAQELAKELAARSKAQFLDIEHGKWYEIGIKALDIT